MKKLVVALVIIAGLLSAFPDLRAKLAPRVEPIMERAAELLDRPLRPFMTPLKRKYARDDVRKIVHDLRVDVTNRGQSPPRRAQFLNWVNANRLTDSEGIDPWGNPYDLLQTHDSLFVYSLGQDGEPGTEDDIRAGFPYRR